MSIALVFTTERGAVAQYGLCKSCHSGRVRTTLGRTQWRYDMPNAGPRYFLDQDNDGHWYVIPCENENEWEEWCNILEGDERGWQPPIFARSVGGSPRLVTFNNPDIE